MSPALIRIGTPPSSVTWRLGFRISRHYLKEYLGNQESEVRFLILKEDVVRVGVNFLGTVVEVQAVVQILLVSLRIQNRLQGSKNLPHLMSECCLILNLRSIKQCRLVVVDQETETPSIGPAHCPVLHRHTVVGSHQLSPL